VSFLEIAGNRFHVIHEGAGPPFVFLHGFPLDHSMWISQRGEFKTSHRVIIPDLRGFGESKAATPATSLADYADDVARILDRLRIKDPVILCGLSMGGYIAFRFLERYADRVSRLILCDTKSAADTPEAAHNRRAMAEKVMTEGSTIVADGMSPKLFASETKDRRPEIIEAIRRVIVSTPAETIAAAQRAMADRPDSTPMLSRISVPTLVLVGEVDVITPPDEMRAMAAVIPQTEFVIIPHAGHMGPLEQPAATNAAIRRFLSFTERRASTP
jgi:pimeloyl-ACP methyl ester carboxylesterase